MKHLTMEQAIQEEEYIIPYPYLLQREKLISFPEKLFVSCDYVEKLDCVFRILPLAEGDRLLDVGCGVGRLAAELAKRGLAGVRYEGGDYSARAVALAQALNPDRSFQVVDLTEPTSFESNRFDRVISIETFEHLQPETVSRALEELFRVLRPGGVGMITVPHCNRPRDAKHFQHFDSRSLSTAVGEKFEILNQHGFHAKGRLRNAPLHLLALLYYFVYPLKKTGLGMIPDVVNRLAYGYFRKCLRDCGVDDGFSLMCLFRKPDAEPPDQGRVFPEN